MMLKALDTIEFFFEGTVMPMVKSCGALMVGQVRESGRKEMKEKERRIKPLNMTYSEEPFRQINFTFVWL